MTLAASGDMSFGGSTATRSINLELGVSATAQRGFNDATSRTLSGTTAGSQVSVSTFYGKSNYTPTTVIRVGVGSTTYTVPTGATTVVIEVWGSGGTGGTSYWDFTDEYGGGGGAGGGYSRSTYSCSGGQTITFNAASATGVASTVSVGGPVGTAMTGTAGQFGQSASFGSPGNGGVGTAGTGGNQANTAGGSGTAGVYGAPGTGGSAVTGVNGGPYGAGGDANFSGGGNAGGVGAVVFRFT